MNRHIGARGFTIVEILFVVAIIGILAAIAGTVYTHYYDPRARAAEVIEQYDAMRTRLQEDYQSNGMRQDCSGLIELVRGNLQSPYVKLDLGTLPVDQNDPTKGHRAVMTITGTLQDHAARGVQIARAAHDNLVKNGVVVGKPILTDSIVLFSLRLSDGPMCQVAMGSASGSPIPAQPQPQAVATPSACPPDKEPYSYSSSGATIRTCVQRCGPGQVRDPNNFRWCTSASPSSQSGTNPSIPAAAVPQLVVTPNVQPTTASTAPAAGGSGSAPQTPNPVQAKQQCQAQCRTAYPHGNSSAYRNCVARCN